ncbi:MAG: PQQ-like beta-propeller repeat protein [Kiritimatiellales bacterium]|nr:PQQ-like beta-propeller repeat protein [Kiritimatiellales bacterium]
MGKWVWFAWATSIVFCSYSADWPVWRGPDANGISSETGLNPTGAHVLWTKELGVGHSTVSVKDGRLYTMGNIEDKDVVYCLDAKTGEKIWDHSYDCPAGNYPGPRATPVCSGDRVYTFSREGLLICFDAVSGAVAWKTDVLDKSGNENIKWGLASSPVIEGDLILLNVGESGVAVDRNSGKIKWKSVGKSSYATPVVFDHKGKRCAAIFSAPGLQIVDVATGKKLDSFNWETKYDINGADPIVMGDRIFISSGYDHGCAMLDFSSGKLKKVWESDVLNNQFSSSILIDGYLYSVDGQAKKKGHLRCISAVDGVEQWSMPIGFGSLISADGKLIALGEDGTLYFAEATPKAYKEISQFKTGLSQLCWTPPALANGIIYCRNDKGTLVAIDVSK